MPMSTFCRNAQLFNFNNKSAIQSSKLLTYLADLVSFPLLLPWLCVLIARHCMRQPANRQSSVQLLSEACQCKSVWPGWPQTEGPQLTLALIYQVVNGPSHPGAVGLPPSKVTPPPPAVPKDIGTQHSWRDVLLEKGPEGWAKDIRAHSGLLLTDTTWYAPQLSSARDASYIWCYWLYKAYV